MPGAGPIRGFSGRLLNGLPLRTYGELRPDGRGGLVFGYHPWLVLPKRKIAVPAGDKVVGKGLLAPVMVEAGGEHGEGGIVVRFPPRYLGHEEQLADRLGAQEVWLLGVRRHFSAAVAWFKEALGDGPRASPESD